jgi:hypothetical protein
MPFDTPPDYSHHIQADAETIKRAQEAQKASADALRARQRQEQEAEKAQRAREADERSRGDQTSQGF